MSTTNRALVTSIFGVLSSALLMGCVGTVLAIPNSHPGNPQARSGKTVEMSGLRSDFDASREGQPSPSASHEHGSGDAAGVRYTCPMHPEIDVSKPGTCPKCGMKLVPKEETQ